MYDMLGQNIFLKVFSHQLTADFNIKETGKMPQLNLCKVSANQHADNAATQAKRVLQLLEPNCDQSHFPAFSPRWCYSFDGCLTNKGATKVLYEKTDEEQLLQENSANSILAPIIPLPIFAILRNATTIFPVPRDI